ncbi:MAG TPA: hypothetical protein PK878_07405 [bacterium]|nr:hypothetical protein [Candidatus Omnitrophota bacterium]HOJ60100.1 hypothetical protein [bacterium]HOL95847.1 hypothetical protein [bacterium]HPP02048.1 hypothetical protein [bacterium]HXK94933.1 hypothetical protein [bacterium]
MKSAYELAMERLEKESPSGPPLSEEQKKELAEIDKIYEAKIAERKIMADQELQKNYGHYEAVLKIQENLREDIQKLEEEREAKKQSVRVSGKQ